MPKRQAPKRKQQRKKPKALMSLKTRPSMNLAPRTVQNVQKALATSNPFSQRIAKPFDMGLDMEYLKCRLGVGMGSGNASIPDGAVRRIVVDHRQFVDFTCSTSGTAWFIVLPAIPITAVFKPNSLAATSGMTINGSAINQPTFGQNTAVGWYPTAQMSEYPNVSNIGIWAQGPFAQTHFRIVDQYYVLTYTGPSALCSGIVTVSEVPIQAEIQQAQTNTITIRDAATDGTPATFTGPNNQLLVIDGNLLPTAITPSTVVLRPEQNVVGKLRKSDPSTLWKDYYDIPLTPVAEAQLSGGVAVAGLAPFVGYINGGIQGCFNGFDTSWTPQFVNISGAASGQQFRLDVVTCVEYKVAINSALVKLTKESKRNSPKSIDMVDQVMSKSPIAVPASQKNHWYNKALSVMNVASKAMKFVPEPTVSAIGTVGDAITTALESLTI